MLDEFENGEKKKDNLQNLEIDRMYNTSIYFPNDNCEIVLVKYNNYQ